MTIEVRAITADEVSAFRGNMRAVFGFGGSEEEGDVDRFLDLLELSRTYSAFDDGELVGTAAAFSFDLTIPGATVAMGGLTNVSVRATHRRQGIMNRMIAAHIADVRGRGEPLSGLWCSEAAIYQRYGYGAVGDSDVIKVDVQRARFVSGHDTDRTALIDEDRAKQVLPALYDRIRPQRPGMLSRNEAWWKHRRFRDPSHVRHGGSSKQYVVASRDDELTGYVVYRNKPKFEDGIASGSIDIIELFAVDEQAEVSLWRLMTSMDLFTTVNWWNAPEDSVLPWAIDDCRRVERKKVDHLWLLICDVPAALSARAYTGDGSLSLQVVHGDQADKYKLDVVYGSGSCTTTDDTPELHLDLAALGSIYMGGVSPRILARAGRIAGDDAALAKAERLFSWPVAPWCPEVF